MRWLNRIFKRRQKKQAAMMNMDISTQQIQKMLQMLEQTLETELSCDEVQDLLDQYTEMAVKGENVQNLLPLVHHHLQMCPDCREEYEALTRILEAQTN